MAHYVLTRKEDGRVDRGTKLGTMDRHGFPSFNRRPKKGHAVFVVRDDFKGRQTSLVTKILSDTPEKVEFKTMNSTYTLEVLGGTA